VKVLIVDDSLAYQSKIKAALSSVPWLQVVATAHNGQEALQILDKQAIDLITLDMEMPILSGIDTLKKIRERQTRPKVIVFSSSTRQGSEKTLEALSLGANDFVAKPVMTGATKTPEQIIRDDLLPKIQQFLPISQRSQARRDTFPAKHIETFIPSIIVLASSTGGPAAHDIIFRDLRGELRCPILIAQHMPPIFTETFAKRLSSYNNLPCFEAKDGEILKNQIYVAPGDFHMMLRKEVGITKIQLNKNATRNSVRPAADFLFESAAELYGPKCMGFVLTGMGEDARDGARAIKQHSGGIMIQNQESCVVFGMPGAVCSAGFFDSIGSLEDIKRQLYRMVLK